MTQEAINQAKVLFGLCQNRSDVERLEKLYFATPALNAVLNNPIVSMSKKMKIIDEVSNRTNQPEIIKNFLRKSCQNDALSEMPDVFKCYFSMCDMAEGIVNAQVFFAQNPKDKELKEASEFLQKKYPDKKIVLDTQVDESLLGGRLIKVGNTEYDESYEGYLRQLERKLT
ncbi:ATP synthase F1 subunit delta [Lachnobacterium bovis]|uniref:ATP synthase F1 subunit delta n=1 Tax=Lachnobacterium bovis TaxID=140626 RepID=UPI0004834CCE|nr:ATP synthase F1 subunit delta [Lachnobacterium bovis]